MVAPNFLLIGTQKSGTTWLARSVEQHPHVFAPPQKELHFFNLRQNYERGIDWYQQQFAACNGERAIGEFTPNYFWLQPNAHEIERLGVIPNIPALVQRHFPDLKLIVSFRHPVRRAVSAYYHYVRSRKVSPYKDILEVGHQLGIVSMGYYATYLREWLRYFPREQFLFLIFEEDIQRRKRETLQRVFRFLGVDPTFVPDGLDERYNSRAGHLYLRMHYHAPRLADGLTNVAPWLGRINAPKIKLDDDSIARLSVLYQQENADLGELIGRPLPWW